MAESDYAAGAANERLITVAWLRTPITDPDDLVGVEALAKMRVLLDMTADMIEKEEHIG